MKNAREFRTKSYHTLSKSEVKLVEKVIDTIASNHPQEDWWTIDSAIKSYVSFKLSRMLADDEFAEIFEEEQARLDTEQAEREQIAKEEHEQEAKEDFLAEEESEVMLKSILSDINEEE